MLPSSMGDAGESRCRDPGMKGRNDMSRVYLAGMTAALVAAGLTTAALAQQPARPQIETTKVEGTDNVYIFHNGNHQSMFIVTRDGVIATDPIGYGRPTGGQDYIAEIKKVTDKPIKYLVYSHHHFDHIAGGKPFKDAGATIVAHRRARERLAVLKDPNTPLPRSGGQRRRLDYQARRHHPRAEIFGSQSLRLKLGDVAAEGKNRLHRRHHPGRIVSRSRFHRHLS